MHYELFTLALMAAFFLGMWGSALVGHRYGRRRVETVGESAAEGTGVVEAAMFALLGLLIAFTFATAYGRFNMRRDLVVQEANAIGTAYLRLDLLPAESQAPLREKFQAYVDSRLRFWEDLTHPDTAREDLGTSTRLQGEIWSEAVKASEDSSTARMLLLPALNEMIDITTTRLNAILARPPTLIFAMLFVLAVLCAWLIGYAMALAKKPNWLHIVGYAAMVTLTVYVILDMEYPRYGLIRLDVAQDMLVEVRKNISGNE
jgi:hypothetical protein